MRSSGPPSRTQTWQVVQQEWFFPTSSTSLFAPGTKNPSHLHQTWHSRMWCSRWNHSWCVCCCHLSHCDPLGSASSLRHRLPLRLASEPLVLMAVSPALSLLPDGQMDRGRQKPHKTPCPPWMQNPAHSLTLVIRKIFLIK